MRNRPLILFLLVLFSLTLNASLLAQNHPPSPVCVDGISSSIKLSDSILIHARVFNSMSFDDNTPSAQLKYAYTESLMDSVKWFKAPTDPDTISTESVRIYVFDEQGAFDYCTTTITKYICSTDSIANNGVSDTIPPVPILRKLTIVDVPPFLNYIGFDAEQFEHASFDDITQEENLHFSFSNDPEDQTRYILAWAIEMEISWEVFVWDEAGNACSSWVSVFASLEEGSTLITSDSTAPTITCQDTIEVFIAQDSLSNIITSDQLILNASDDFVPTSLIDYYFEDESDVWLFSCENLGANEVELFAEDFNENVSSCFSTIQVLDSNDICTTSTFDSDTEDVWINIYPNPASTTLHIGGIPSSCSVSIIDVAGRVIYKNIISTSTFTINTRKFVSGIKFIHFRFDNGKEISKKLILEN